MDLVNEGGTITLMLEHPRHPLSAYAFGSFGFWVTLHLLKVSLCGAEAQEGGQDAGC